jgi:TorA maturation chaperone TorD
MTDFEQIQLTELEEAAQARVAFYSFLNLFFLTLVEPAFVTRLRNGELSAVLETLKQEGSNREDITAGAALMLGYLDKTSGMDLDKLTESLGVDRTRLYRGVAKGYGPPPPYELVWSKKGGDFGVLQSVSRAYREAGLEPPPDIKERLDHISVEMAFLQELAQNEASAWNSGEDQSASRTLERQRDFMDQHFGEWVPFFIEKAFEYVETDFYRGHLLMLRGFILEQKDFFSTLSLFSET